MTASARYISKEINMKIAITICMTLVSLWVIAQPLTVKQLDKKWLQTYEVGCKAFRDHDNMKSLSSLNEARALLEDNDAKNTNSYIFTIMKLAEVYYATSNKAELAKLNSEIIEIGKHVRPGSQRYTNYAYHLSLYYSNTGQYQKAIDCIDKFLAEQKGSNISSDDICRFLHRKSLCCYFLGDYSGAIENEQLSIGNDENKKSDLTESLLYYLYKTNNWDKFEENLPASFDNAREPILRMFSQSKSKGRAEYWSMHGLFFTDYLPFYALKHPSPTLASYAYNAALLSKGVLLAAQNKSDEITLSNSNAEFLASYKRYKELQAKKDKTADEEFEMQALSDVMLRYQKEHKNEYRKDFRIRWMDVKNVLTDEDVAIEFQTASTETGGTDYFAITLKKSYSVPKITRLCSIDDVKKISSDKLYTTSALFNLIWQPLENEVSDMKNVYFSPSGFIYNTGIEYLPNDDGENFNAFHNVCRLSSTKELVLSSREKLKKAVLFGGVNYDTKISQLATQSKDFDYTSTTRSIDLDSLDIRSSEVSGGVAYLPGTMEEVEEVSNICEESNVSSLLYCGDDGSEISFCNIGGSDADIVHVATHGFYYENKNIGHQTTLDKLYKDANLHFTSDEVTIIDEDKMLTRSGLLMAGANNFLKRIKIPQGIQDGILYADEISHVDFRNVKLLVLSACQSGLGDIAASEGVFGLQRGFKLAGVKSIIMSLWKVDDAATKILMTEMYKQLKNTASVREALTNAQLHLRTVEDGKYDNPKFWAAFIILDNI